MAINKTLKTVNYLTKGKAYTCWTTFANAAMTNKSGRTVRRAEKAVW